jgi:hypothetical protein
VQESLAAKGIEVELSEVQRHMQSIPKLLEFEVSYPEALEDSVTADLARTGPDSYTVRISAGLMNQITGSLPDYVMNTAISLATYYVAGSAIAVGRGHNEYELKVGDKIGLADLFDAKHPVHSLFPVLTEKTLQVQ